MCVQNVCDEEGVEGFFVWFVWLVLFGFFSFGRDKEIDFLSSLTQDTNLIYFVGVVNVTSVPVCEPGEYISGDECRKYQ